MGIKVLKGRDFSRGIAADVFDVDSATDKIGNNREQYNKVASSKSIIVNEETLKLLDLKYSEQFVIPTGAVKGTVVGEVQNFNGLTLHEKIPALVIRCNPNEEFGQMYIRISQPNIQQTIKYIQNKWSRFYPDQQFEFSFVDQKLQQLYTADKRVGQLFGVFASLAIVIACLGLFGLISLTVQQRVKEIGIRKVLGASVADITTLLSADFLKLVFISMLIASPVAWYLMNKWLTNFAYHINISWMVFALSAMAALLVAFITIGTQAVKAALANPVKSLRSE
jgi:putative ABC transport system permease protein